MVKSAVKTVTKVVTNTVKAVTTAVKTVANKVKTAIAPAKQTVPPAANTNKNAASVMKTNFNTNAAAKAVVPVGIGAGAIVPTTLANNAYVGTRAAAQANNAQSAAAKADFKQNTTAAFNNFMSEAYGELSERNQNIVNETHKKVAEMQANGASYLEIAKVLLTACREVGKNVGETLVEGIKDEIVEPTVKTIKEETLPAVGDWFKQQANGVKQTFIDPVIGIETNDIYRGKDEKLDGNFINLLLLSSQTYGYTDIPYAATRMVTLYANTYYDQKGTLDKNSLGIRLLDTINVELRNNGRLEAVIGTKYAAIGIGLTVDPGSGELSVAEFLEERSNWLPNSTANATLSLTELVTLVDLKNSASDAAKNAALSPLASGLAEYYYGLKDSNYFDYIKDKYFLDN